MISSGRVTAYRRLFVAVLLVTLTSCGTLTPSHVIQEGATVVPTSSIQDLVTYGDVAVLFTIVSERELAPTPEELERGEGTVTRQLTAQQQGGVLWSRPSRGKSAQAAPVEWTISDGGWIFRGGNLDKRTRLSVSGRPALTVGGRYIAVRTFSTLGGDTPAEWFSLCYVAIEDGKAQFDRPYAERESAAYAAQLEGLSVAGIKRLLGTTAPDASALPYMRLDAAHRYQKLFER